MCNICAESKKVVGWAMERFRQFDVMDVAVFKVCLLSLGVLIGTYLVQPLKKVRWLLWVAFGASYLYVIWRLIRDE